METRNYNPLHKKGIEKAMCTSNLTSEGGILSQDGNSMETQNYDPLHQEGGKKAMRRSNLTSKVISKVQVNKRARCAVEPKPA